MSIQEQKPHFGMLPYVAQGHMIPMMDLARLLAKRGLTISILTTPHNAGRFKFVVDRAIATGLDIHILHLKFPSSQVGLPDGCENFDMLSSSDDLVKMFRTIDMLKEQVEALLRQLKPSPTCFIADACFPSWATTVALKLHIPRILFYVTTCFSLLCRHVQRMICQELEAMASDTEYFVLPGLPDRIELTRAQFRGTPNGPSFDWSEFWDEMREAETEAFGAVVALKSWNLNTSKNTRKPQGKESDYSDKAERGNIGEHEYCLKWLDNKEPGSVVYVCLGSQAGLATSPLIELALGLEASSRPFIWVLKNASEESQKWLFEEKFEEGIKDRGLLIRGWAPQVLILSHPSVGAFFTHCGGNSTLEGIIAGLPMITWPVFSDHFCNEKLIVNVIKTGLRAGVEEPVILLEEDHDHEERVQVKNDEIKRVIEMLMDGGEEGNERRKRAKELGEMAKRAMEEGGSSYLNLTLFIQDVIAEQTLFAGPELSGGSS
ncbi:UDP-glycosyltransferase 73C3 [Sesamum alatum]|uniref:Glycosyltransferase n=1 Tax=Sesamum alatum TaxID=300844 RepID=A0AAE2CW63_9LAMI|nr:UDP-glycosyltransferase 73C3 [Sesamum alatum]